MSTREPSLIGSVFERRTPRTPSAPPFRFTATPRTGFPAVQHRSKSAFARARDEAANSKSVVSQQTQTPPSIALKTKITEPKPIPTDTDALRRQIHEENAERVARMSEEEVEQEKRAILEQLGEGTTQLLRRVLEARRRKANENETQTQVEPGEQAVHGAQGKVEVDPRRTTEYGQGPITSPTLRHVQPSLASKPGVLRVRSLENMGRSVPSPLPATSSTRPSSRAGRKLRFAEVTPDDVHVYESAPVSPKRTILALPPPPDTKDDSIVSLGTFRKDTLPRLTHGDDEPEEGTPEFIRRRFFPGASPNDPSLAWMETSHQGTTDETAPRFDLHGSLIPASLSTSLPSHLGLHHHAEGSHAGYTIDDIFLLARSTVPAQRASMLGILAKIAHRLGQQARHYDDSPEQTVFPGQEGALRKRILSAGLAAIGQIGSLGARSVEVVWECLVEWDTTTTGLEGVELALAPDIVSSLQLEYFLPQITDVLSHAALPPESLAQLLAVIHWLAQQSNQIADMIMTTPHLVPTILNTFLLTPIPPKEESPLPNPLALQLLITLASASRSNASALLDPADALLRFVTLLPPSSPYPSDLASMLLTYTLRFYTALASYGFYSHIATSASQIFVALSVYISSTPIGTANISASPDTQFHSAWAALVEVWTVCATNPHATNPPHEILWSQIRAWGWATDMRKLRRELSSEMPYWALYAAIWDVETAWLEGARVNGIKGGEREREEALQVLNGTFAAKDGVEFGVVQRALEAVKRDLMEESPTTAKDGQRLLKSFASAGNILTSALRLWLACIPSLDTGTPLTIPPFALPLSELSALSAALVKHPVWFLASKLGAPYLQVYLRPLSNFLAHFHRVSRYIPGTSPQLWFTQALVFLPRLLRGDESHALAMLDAFLFVTLQFVGVDSTALLENVHVEVLQPFFENAIRPEGGAYVAPLRPNTDSIVWSSSLRLPLPSSHAPQSLGAVDGDDANQNQERAFAAGLPLTRDFLFTPLTHLLRSGTSPVFRTLPSGWTASEVDVVRATLFLVYAARRVLIAHGLEAFVHSPAEVVWGCMQVCMLEHGVNGSIDMETEVFRDASVERLMEWLLEPFTMRRHAASRKGTGPHVYSLEDASAPYLGSTPFYQFYTDLVSLYGAVSFGHRIFAALLVTPLAMHYAVDYRRALWCSEDGASSGPNPGLGGGLGDVVRSVRISIEDAICTVGEGGDPREYLYPIERDVGILGAYVAALVARNGGGVEGFLRLVAVHHVACTVWEDLDQKTSADTGMDEAAKKETEAKQVRLLKVIIAQGETDVVKDVVLYRQHASGQFLCPPTCYLGGEDQWMDGNGWRKERMAFVRRMMKDGDVERLEALLMPPT